MRRHLSVSRALADRAASRIDKNHMRPGLFFAFLASDSLAGANVFWLSGFVFQLKIFSGI